MVVIDSDGVLDVDDLTEDLQAGAARSAGDRPAASTRWSASRSRRSRSYYIAETLKLTGGNREEAAKLLGIGERTLYRKLKGYGK